MLIVAQPRVPEPGAVDHALLAQARRARPAVGRRRARGEESAERDDDSPRAAAAAVRRARAGARRARGRGAAAVAAAEPPPSTRAEALAARRRDRQRDPAARRSRAGVPEVHAARGPEAAAGARCRRCSTRSCRSCSPRPSAPASQLVVECDGAPDVNGDPAMLRQAFLNLALNACQAMPNGGTLRIHCEAARGRRVSIAFADTGVGIKPEHLQRIFDLYFTTKEKGSGIGLSMVYRTVQMHDGEIEVQSTPGDGHDVPGAAAAGLRRHQMKRRPVLRLLPCCVVCLPLISAGCHRAHAQDACPRCPPLDVPAPPPRVSSRSKPRRRSRCRSPEEPARTPPPRSRPRRAASSRREPNRRSRSRRRPNAAGRGAEAGRGAGQPPTTLQTTPPSRKAKLERGIRALLDRAHDRSEPHRLPRAERGRADAVRHREELHPPGRGSAAARRIWCSRRQPGRQGRRARRLSSRGR